MEILLFDKNNTGDIEIKELASWTVGHRFTYLIESIIIATRWLESIVSEAVLIELDGFYRNDLLQDSAVHKNAWEYAQRAILNEAYRIALPKIAVQVNNASVSVAWSDTLRPALAEKAELISSLKIGAYDFANLLIEKMEANIGTFPAWQASKEKMQLGDILIKNAFDFSAFYFINNSQAEFYSILPNIRRAQIEFTKVACGEKWDEVTSWANTGAPDTPTKQILHYAKSCTAYAAIYFRIKQNYAEIQANGGEQGKIQARLNALDALAKYERQNADDYSKLIRDAIAALDAPPAITEEFTSDYLFPFGSGNSLIF